MTDAEDIQAQREVATFDSAGVSGEKD